MHKVHIFENYGFVLEGQGTKLLDAIKNIPAGGIDIAIYDGGGCVSVQKMVVGIDAPIHAAVFSKVGDGHGRNLYLYI